jgi:16S rRNA (cytosine967-C5)-methyltransferase
MNLRLVAYGILNKVFLDKAYSNIALNQSLLESGLIDLDKRLVTNIVYGVIQNSILLDYFVKKLVDDKKINPKMRTILKMSYYQLYYLDKLPSYAIVNDGVQIAKEDMGMQSSKFANAILRKMVNTKVELTRNEFKDIDEYYATLYSIPLWLFKMIKKQYGEAEALAWAEISKLPPFVSCRVNTTLSSVNQILENKNFVKGNVADNSVMFTGSDSVFETSEYKAGLISPQDESGQLVAPQLDPQPGDYILDMCAAPGSKTMHLAELAQDKAKIIAIDLYPHRVKMIEASKKRLQIKGVSALELDALTLKNTFKDQEFDKILLDAPCSGYGVIQRKPDILLNTKQENLDQLIKLQQGLIDQALLMLKKGGTFVYSTCTLNRKENDLQVAYALSKDSNLKLVGSRQILPSEYQSDGFFYAKFIKE